MNSGVGAARLIDCIAARPASAGGVAQAAHDERGEGEEHATDETARDGRDRRQRRHDASRIAQIPVAAAVSA